MNLKMSPENSIPERLWSLGDLRAKQREQEINQTGESPRWFAPQR
jgi:hypothetical protein